MGTHSLERFYVGRASHLASRLLGDETIILNTANSSFFTLNETASAIWLAADGRKTVDEIVDRLCEAFDVERETAVQDAKALVEGLVQHGLLVLSPEPVGEGL